MPSFISELRRRNVLRVAAAYGLIAWIIIEAGSVLLPTFGASEGTFQVYVIVVLAGFFASVVFAWAFEITPEGVKLDRDIDRSQPVDRRPKVIMNYVIIGLLVIALGISITFNITGMRDAPPQVAEQATAKPSLAVLPFTSLSTEPDNALFADGIHDDLLTKLATIGSCKVISRTSVMEYRDTTKNSGQIGEELGVGALLQGSVQRIGDDVRINVTLVDADTGANLWAQQYNRQLTAQNVFAIQSEISGAIAIAMETTLTPAEQDRLAAVPTDDLRAYSLYVSARDNLYLRQREPTIKALEQFRQAVDYDPDYAAAHVGVAESAVLLYINHGGLPRSEALALAQDSLDTALEHDEMLADAYATLGLLKTQIWSESRIGTENLEAEAAFRRAIELNPNHARAYMWFASLRNAEQRDDEAIELYQRSMELDPLGRVPYSNLPVLYSQQGHYDEALRLWLEAKDIHPEWSVPYRNIAVQLASLGRLDEALAWIFEAQTVSGNPVDTGNLGIGIYYEFGEEDKARAILESYPHDHQFSPLVPAFKFMLGGDFSAAHEYFTSSVDELRESLPPFVLILAADAALMAGDLDTARELVLESQPVLADDRPLQVDRFTIPAIIRLGYIHQRRGNDERATELLTATLPVARGLPRFSLFGRGITDVQILALLGRTDEALTAFEEAVDEGFRSEIVGNTFTVDLDPFLDSIRDHPRFTRAMETIRVSVAFMHERVRTAEEAGDWNSLLALVVPKINN